MEPEKSPGKRGHGRVSRYVPLVLCIALILFLSTGEASHSNTSRIIGPLLQFLFPAADAETLAFYHFIIRKLAHLTEYGLLAFLAARAFNPSKVKIIAKHRYAFAVLLVAGVAAIDELNQSMSAERSGSATDVAIDLAGGLIGVLLFAVFTRIRGGQKRIVNCEKAEN